MADLSGRDLAWLERRRGELFGLLSQVGDFRRGALNAVWRRCGKPNCAYAQPGHGGHGPQYNLTRRVGGTTVNAHLRPGPELEKAEREVAEHQRFLALLEEVSEVSEAICAAGRSPAWRPSGGGERGLAAQVAEVAAAEVGKLAGLAAGMLGQEGAGLGVLEQAMRAALASAGARLLQAVLAGEDGYAVPRADCGQGHQGAYAGGRPKTFGPVHVERTRTLPAWVVVCVTRWRWCCSSTPVTPRCGQAGRGPGLGAAVPGAPVAGDAAGGGCGDFTRGSGWAGRCWLPCWRRWPGRWPGRSGGSRSWPGCGWWR